MGFWDGGLGDLQIAGIQTTALEEQVLEEGGSFCYMRPLLHPFDEYNAQHAEPLRDSYGNPLLVPVRCAGISPIDSYTAAWRPNSKPIWKQIDDNFGTEWRSWPANIGVAIDTSLETVSGGIGMDYYWVEEPRPYRMWSCFPIADADTLAAVIRLEHAAGKALQASCYLDLMWLESLAQSGEINPEDICIALNMASNPAWSRKKAKAERAACREYVLSYYTSLEDAVPDGRTLKHLVDEKILCWPWASAEERAQLRDLEIPPITEYLDPGDEFAQTLWNRALTRRRLAITRVSAAYYTDPRERRLFEYREEQIAS